MGEKDGFGDKNVLAEEDVFGEAVGAAVGAGGAAGVAAPCLWAAALRA